MQELLSKIATASQAEQRFGGIRRRSSLRHAMRKFARHEHGTMTLFAIYMAVIIMMFCGIAVDVMRFEAVRTGVQNVEDTAVLAAANLNETLDPTSVVNDYFAKAGMSTYLKSVTVSSTLGAKSVSATSDEAIPTFFMRLAGINSLDATARSTAAESIGNVEVALALDNSGSMNEQAQTGTTTTCTTKRNKQQSCRTSPTYSTKIALLRTAASEFVDTLFAQTQPGTLTMSILPYDSHLDIGNELLADLNTTYPTGGSPSKCIDNSSLDFTTTAISTTTPLLRVPVYDPGYSMSLGSITKDCTDASYRDSLVYSADPTALKTLIGSLTAGGNTSIDTGVKWAAATLDPSFQPVVNAMISKGELTSVYSGRPAQFSDHSVMKVLIVMSDGENTTRYGLNPAYASGPSPVWHNPKASGNNAFSIYSPAKNQYYSIYRQIWQAKPFGQNSGDTGYPTTPVNWTYPQVWADMSTYYYTWYLYGAAFGSTAGDNLWNTITTQVQQPAMDSAMSSICSAAKNQGILVFSIGFQTSSHGAATLTSCATDSSYYFDAEGSSISSVFAKIANSIIHLRLTQ